MKAELQVQTQKEHLLQDTAENRKQLHKIKYENPMTAMNNLQKELNSTFWLLIALSSAFARKTDWELLTKNGKIITLHL
jgi:glycerol-3-phosphate dehydrogenase